MEHTDRHTTGKELPHIGLRLADDLPQTLITDFEKELSHEKLRLQVVTFPFGGPYMSMEWAIPSVIGIFILKGYFDGFLKEAGKDHYTMFKTWLQKKANATRTIKTHTIAASQSSEKLLGGNTQSSSFSIETKTKDDFQIKFLFDETLPEADWDRAIENALSLMSDHFTGVVPDRLSLMLQEKKLSKVVFAIIRSDTGEWDFLDYRDIYRIHLDSQQ